MITENLQRRPVSAAMAESWLQRVRELLAQYTRFTAQLTDALQQTVSHGLPFPDPGWYTESTALLAGQRQDLLEEIRGSAWMPESAGWDLPAADAPLQLIIDSLADLQQVSTELQRQQAELLPRYLELATTAARLTSRDEAVMPHLEPLRQQARRFQQQLELQPWVVAERDVQGQMEAFQSLFLLLAESQRPLPVLTTPRREGLAIAEIERHFGEVESRWGRRLALAAIRGLIFSATFPGCGARGEDISRASAEPGELSSPAVLPSPATDELAQPSTQPLAQSAAPAVAEKPVDPVNAPATPEQLRNLVKTFGRNLAPSTPARGVVPIVINAPPTARGTSTAELAALAGSAAALAKRAAALWPAVTDPQQHASASTAEQLRALGWKNLAFALDLAGELLAERSRSSAPFRSELVELLNLTAEAQNAVRVEAEGREVITEQDHVFQWMRAICHEHSEGVRIDRYMRRDDRASPDSNADVSARLQVLGKKIRDHILQERLLRLLEELIGNLKREVSAGESADSSRRNHGDWTRIDQTVAELLKTGLHENHCGLRDLLLPVVDLIPESGGPVDEDTESSSAAEFSDATSDEDEFSPEFNRVLNSISMHLARSANVVQQETEAETADVQYVRERLAGQSIAIVGGVCKPHASARIQKALKLREVRWLGAGKNDRVSQFETDVRGMALVVLITKLIGHKHNDIREFCRNQGVPWVQTKIHGGYSVNQLAHLIREQASEYLDRQKEELGERVGSEK